MEKNRKKSGMIKIKEVYSVALVYEKEVLKENCVEIDTVLKVLITEAVSPQEALGKAIEHLHEEMIGYAVSLHISIPVSIKIDKQESIENPTKYKLREVKTMKSNR